jgi:CO/xanthine dehydrogenase Mo-binding subunit
VSDRPVRRREFLELLGGLVVVVVAGDARGQESGRSGPAGATGSDLSAWLHIAEDGTVTVYTGKVEIGQNIRTALAQAVAEELRAPLSSIEIVMGDTDRTPFDMGTFGSRTTPTMAPVLRKAAVVAREMLKELAAERWHVEAASLVVADGRVSNPQQGRSIGFGELTQGRKLVRSLEVDVALTPADRWTVAGRPVTKVNGPDLVTGLHRYPSDLKRPGMWHGRVLRAPTFGATLLSLDAAAAEAVPGVVVVRDGDFAGVAAARASTAARALSTLEPRWKETPQPSGQELFSLLRKGGGSPSRGGPFVIGSVPEAMAAAKRRLEATYTVAYIAHVPLEPRAALAEWSDGRLTVWTGTQRPFGVKSDLAEAFHLAEDRVRVIVPDMGSGYGGKHTAECAIEAARLAKGAGRPVKVVWSREEEFCWAYFRPAGIIDIRSGVDSGGKLVAWEMHNYNSGSSGIRTPYDVPHQRIEFHPAESPLRQGSYRGLASTANHFARESHMDELAVATGVDPLEMRRRNLKEPRLRAVLDAVAERFGWAARKLSPGRGHGIACGTEKGSYVATAAEVEVGGGGKVRVLRLVTAFECGAIVNPDGLRNQVEGSVLMGLGGALFEEVEFDAGRILNPRLSEYRVPRFSDVPEVDVVLLDRRDLPSEGAGETPIVAVAPAVAGGIFAATGRRLRALPLAPRGVPGKAGD